MAIELNIPFFKTVPGILKLVECTLTLIVLLIARFGGIDGNSIAWRTQDILYLGIGASVGYAIIIPALILDYILGASSTTLEYIITLLGGVLFISTGASMVDENDEMELVVACLSIVLGVLFLIDFVYRCTKNRQNLLIFSHV